MRLFKLHDTNPEFGAVEVYSTEEAEIAQGKGYGIFSPVNEFNGARRIENLVRIRSWYSELDEKPDLRELIESLPMHPSVVNETKNGYHLYFHAQNATLNRYKIIQKRICKKLGGDPNALDAARMLRTPGFMHLKDPSEPFLVNTVWKAPVAYREEVMLQAWPAHDDEFEKPKPQMKPLTPTGDSFLDKVWSLNQGDLLMRLSGKACVCFEQYTLKRTSRGHNILVNGKSTSCFIDRSGRIGSADGGGPGVINWLMWFGNSFKEAMEILKEELGEM